jgi:uncharacterized membrane protein
MTTRANTLGILAMAATAFLWSIAGLFIKIIDWNPLTIAGFRSLIASLVVLLYLKRPKFHWSFPQVAAAFANAATMLLFVSANKTTTSANAILLQYISPVFTAFIGAALLRERARLEHWIAFLLVALGMILMFMDKLGGGRTLGNVLALLSAITLSLYFVFMRMQKEGSPLESILLSHWIRRRDRRAGALSGRRRGDPIRGGHHAHLGRIGQPDCRHRAGLQPDLGLSRPGRDARPERRHRRSHHRGCRQRRLGIRSHADDFMNPPAPGTWR